MSKEFSDELISAYLDGELGGDEQSRVEELLMDSVEHRKMFKELRALRESLQSLPSYTLGDGFTDRVVQQAERVMTVPTEPTAVQPVDDDRPSPRRVNHQVVWTIVSVAALLLIAICFPALNQMFTNGNGEIATTDSGTNANVDDASDEGGGKNATRKIASRSGKSSEDRSADNGGRTQGNVTSESATTSLHESRRSRTTEPNATREKVTADESPDGQRRSDQSGRPFAADEVSRPTTDIASTSLTLTPRRNPVFVYVDVPNQELTKRGVDRSLAANGIAMVDGRDQLALSAGALRSDADKKELAEITRRVTESSNSRLRKANAANKGVDLLASREMEVLVVCASRQQIHSTFENLKAKGYAVTIQNNELPKSTGSQSNLGRDLSTGDSADAAVDKFRSLKDGEKKVARGALPSPKPTAPAKSVPADDKNFDGKNLDQNKKGKGKLDDDEPTSGPAGEHEEFDGRAAKARRSFAYRLNTRLSPMETDASKHQDFSKGDAATAPGSNGVSQTQVAGNENRNVAPAKRLSPTVEGFNSEAQSFGGAGGTASEIDNTTIHVILVIRAAHSPSDVSQAAEKVQPAAKKE